MFGGDTLTATDIAVAKGRADLGDATLVADLDPMLVDRAWALIDRITAEAVDRVKTSATDVPVMVVGGGSIIVGNDIPGASAILKPEHFAVANAIGAAIAQVSGQVERMFSLDEVSRDEALESAKAQAIEMAIAAGAEPDTVEIVHVEDVPLAYLPGNATRVQVKAAGNLRLAEEA